MLDSIQLNFKFENIVIQKDNGNQRNGTIYIFLKVNLTVVTTQLIPNQTVTQFTLNNDLFHRIT